MSMMKDGWWMSLQDFCDQYDVSRNVAYKLIDDELLDSFLIGRRRYIIGASIEALPKKMREMGYHDRLTKKCFARGVDCSA